MRRTLTPALCLLTLLATGANARADFDTGYFPVARGNTWVYRDAAGAEQTVDIDSTRLVGSTRNYRLRGFNGSSHWIRQTTAGRVYAGTTSVWYRFDGAVGTSWTFAVSGSSIPGSNGARLQVVSRNESLTVPAGTFSTIHLRWRASGVADAGITDEWFAKGVGLVKRTEQSIAGPRSRVLVRATISGAAIPSGGGGGIIPVIGGNSGAYGIKGVVPASRVTLRVILAQDLSRPAAMAFHPVDRSLWIVNRADDSFVIVDDAGLPTMRRQKFLDDSDHFNNNPLALAFSRRRVELAVGLEMRNDYNGGAAANDFSGPTLWDANRTIFTGGAASHLDMLHHSPLAHGIAAGAATTGTDRREYFVFNGLNGCIDRYFFNEPHVHGGHDHSDGLTYRYGSGLRRVANVPGHLALDTASGVLYIADTGNGRIAKLDTRAYDLATATQIVGVHNETPLLRLPNARLDSVTAAGVLTRPAGLIVSASGKLIVSDNGTGKISVFSKDGALEGSADTGLGAGALSGLVETRDGKLWVLDMAGGRVLEVNVQP